jgi:23S rRNA (adenine2503-C2)-methyltransferase
MFHGEGEGCQSVRAGESPRSGEPARAPIDSHESTRRPVFSATTAEWRDWMVERGYPAYRAHQVLDWVVHRRAESFLLMSDLPMSLRRVLDAEFTIFGSRVVHHDVAPDATRKLLLEYPDGQQIECVVMAEGARRTACLSTQVGCAMGCTFCASGLKGVERNLTAGEIVEQALRLRNTLPQDETVTHIVVMGMGESLANLDNLVAALDRLCSPEEGLGISQRRVTISTVGLPEKIARLAEADRQYHLAVSLHAPTEELRNTLVPVNESIGLGRVLEAADAYFRRTGRQVTYEYVLLHGVNDRPSDARALARLLEARRAHVNLIPYNPVPGLSFDRPDSEAVERFVAVLREHGVSVTVRKTKGRRIDAACGQLRRRIDLRRRQERRGDVSPSGRDPGPPLTEVATAGLNRGR